MGKALAVLVVISFIFSGRYSHAQTIQVSDPRLEMKDNRLLISYDILNSGPVDKFIVNLQVTDANGKSVNTHSLSGDIGEGISGGENKKITWDPEADSIYLDADIFITLFATRVSPPEPVITPKESIPAEHTGRDDLMKEDHVKEDIPENVYAKEFSRAGLIFQSLALPGLGLSRLTGKPHWLRGVAGYGCIAGAIVFNKVAIATYQDFKMAETIDGAASMLAEAARQDNISEALAYSAIGIWVVDLIWTVTGTSEIGKRPLYGEVKGLSFRTGFDPRLKVPLVGFSYSF